MLMITNVTVLSGSIQLVANKLSNDENFRTMIWKWRIKINVNKYSTSLFLKRLAHLRNDPPPLNIFHTNIAWTNEIKYLGIIIDSKLTYRLRINKSADKENHRFRQLYPILNKSSSIKINLALTICKTLIRPIITYAAPAWGYAAKTHFSELHVFRNDVLRIITKLPRVRPIAVLLEQIGVEIIKSHVRKVARKLYFKSQFNDNSQIGQLGQYDPIFVNTKDLRPISGLICCMTKCSHAPYHIHSQINWSPIWEECFSFQCDYSSESTTEDPVHRQYLRLSLRWTRSRTHRMCWRLRK
jgi:hypothetical protein